MGSLCTVVELQNIFHCPQQYNVLLDLRVNFHIYFFPILTKFGISRQTFIRFPNIKFREVPCIGSGADICGRTDMTTLITAFRYLCERA